MTRYCRLLVLAGLCGFASLRAQDVRDSLVSKAFGEFDAPHRVQLLTAALDPALGPPRGAWTGAVQLLAQTLLEEGQDSLAAVWLRWAVRLAPDFRPDTVQFLPPVATAHAAAREFVTRTSTPDDSLVASSWIWAKPDSARAPGRIQLATGSVPDSARVSVAGLGVVSPGAGTSAAPGSYAIRVLAAGYDSARVTREVLPGVTTMIEFRLRSSLEQVAQPPPPRNRPPAPVATKKKGFPWLWVGLGAGGAATLALVLKPRPNPSTGGITFTFPNP